MNNQLRGKLKKELKEKGREGRTWSQLYNEYPFKGDNLTNKQKADAVRSVQRLINRATPKVTKQEGLPKILIFDIETAPLLGYVWRLFKQNVAISQLENSANYFLLTWSAKWLFQDEIMNDRLTSEEAINEDDERITKSLWTLLDEADIVVAHYACVQKDTPILMQDLTWKKAGELQVGDALVGFDEKNPPETPRRDINGKWKGGKERKVKASYVTNIKIEKRHCLKVIFDNGDSVITTDDHYWLGMSENCRNQQWYRTDKLRIGQKINKFISPWEKDNSYEAAWLSGFLAGEGCLKGNGASIDFAQRPTVVLDQALDHCKKLNIPLSEPKTKKGGLGRGDCLHTYTLGGKWKNIETLGKLDVKRLINNIDWNNFGGLNSTANNDTTRTVIKIEDAEYDEVAILETSTKTYIADGYPMHNCGFDVPMMNNRFIMHRLPPPSPYIIIDTKQHASKAFKFPSNKLDYIAQQFGVGSKIKTDFDLWRGCLRGDEKALQQMSAYNDMDVKILEDVYLIMRPYIKPHPNVSLFIEDSQSRCPTCASDQLEEIGTYNTNVSAFVTHRCKSCGSTCRTRHNIINKNKRDSILLSV